MRGISGPGFGIINPGDNWLIDRKWGNPGTIVMQMLPSGQYGLRGFGADGSGITWWDRLSGETKTGIFMGGAGLLGIGIGILVGRRMKRKGR